MELKKRNCNVDVEVEILAKRWQRISMTINGERHEHVASAAVSNMFGDLVDVLYELYATMRSIIPGLCAIKPRAPSLPLLSMDLATLSQERRLPSRRSLTASIWPSDLE